MKSIFYILFLFSSWQMKAQEFSSLDISGGFDYSKNTELDNAIFSSSDISYNGIYALNLGVNFNVRVFDKSMFKTGLRYLLQGEKLVQDNVRWPSEIGPNGFNPNQDLPRSIVISTSHRFIELPLLFRFELTQKKFVPYIEFGTAFQYYSNTKLTRTKETGDFSETIDYTEVDGVGRINMAAILAVGMNYRLNNKIKMYLQPIWRFTVNSFTDGTKYSNAGIEFGIRRIISNAPI